MPTEEKICKTCKKRYTDGMCMEKLTYMRNNDKCINWSDKKLEFSYTKIYELAKEYIKLSDDYKKYKKYSDEHPEEIGVELNLKNYEFFFNCCLNDLHREMSLWETKM